MLQITIRSTLGVAGLTTAIIVTCKYYPKMVECLPHLEKLAQAAIPTVLALALLWQVLKNVLSKQLEEAQQWAN